MTIRRQIFLYITLLFVGVGFLGAAVAYWLETEVVRQMFDDQAHGLAVTVAEFIEPADIAALRGGAPLTQGRLGPVWSRLGRWAIVQRLFLLDPASGRPLADTAPAGTPLPGETARRSLAGDEIRALPLRFTGDGRALATRLALTAGGAAVVGVELSADDYLQERTTILHDVETDAALAALMGLAVAAALTWLIRRPILRLGQAVQKIGTPEFSDAETDSVIQEVAEVGNSMGVLHSVLGETVEKGRRALFESEAYRSESGLAAVFQQELQPAAAWSGGGAEAAWLSVGSPPPAALTGAVALGGADGAAFIGETGPAGELGAAVRARAAADYLADVLTRQPLAAAAADTVALFGLARLEAARWTDGALAAWRGGTAIPAGAGAVDLAAWAAGRPVTLACAGPINRGRLGLYLESFSARATERVLSELPPLLDAREPGVLLLLRRRPTT